MFSRWSLFVCIFSRCDPDPKTCVCKRCGRVKHLLNHKPKVLKRQSELCGSHKNGRVVYLKTEDRRYTCLRCGESHDESLCKYEFR